MHALRCTPKADADTLDEHKQSQLRHAIYCTKTRDTITQRSLANFEVMVSEAVMVKARYREESSRNAAPSGGGRREGGQRPPAVYWVKGKREAQAAPRDPAPEESVRVVGQLPGGRKP